MDIKFLYKLLFLPGLIAIAFVACLPTTTTVESTHVIVSPSDNIETAQIIPTQILDDINHIPLIWDDDGSPDGVIALLYFLSHPKVDVLAATVSYGEAHPEYFAQYIVDMLNYLDYQDIPVGAGRDSPIKGNNAFPGFLRNPTDTFWDVPIPASDIQISPLSAPELIVETIQSSPEPVILFVSGSFTNVAEALKIDPSIISNIKAIECMGGAIYDPGNVGGVWDFGIDNKFAEWNIYVDPYAAEEVFATSIEINLTPLDATNKVYTNRDDQTQLRNIGSPTSDLVVDLLEWKFNFQNSDEFTIFDLLAAVNTTDPQVCEWTDLLLNVVIADGNELGRTFIDSSVTQTTKVCLEPDEDAVNALVVSVFTK